MVLAEFAGWRNVLTVRPGGALVHLTATYLQKLLGTGVTVTAKAFASPRVGNQVCTRTRRSTPDTLHGPSAPWPHR